MVAAALDEGRIGGLEGQHPMLCQIYGILESAARDSCHNFAWGCSLLGLSDPDARPDAQWTPAEASAVIAWQREAATLETAKKQLMTPIGKATTKVKRAHPSDDDDDDSVQKPIRSIKSSNKDREAKAKVKEVEANLDQVVTFMMLASSSFADVPCRFPRHPRRSPLFLALCLVFPDRLHEIFHRGGRDRLFPSHVTAASDPDASQPEQSSAL